MKKITQNQEYEDDSWKKEDWEATLQMLSNPTNRSNPSNPSKKSNPSNPTNRSNPSNPTENSTLLLLDLEEEESSDLLGETGEANLEVVSCICSCKCILEITKK